MRIAILSFDGFNEIDSFVPLGLLNRLKPLGWSAELCGPGPAVTSMNGVTVQLDRLQIDPTRQLIASQCSGALLVARLGLLGDAPACTDSSTRPWLVEAGVRVLDEPFHARGPVATSGGCLASQYLSAWIMWSKAGESAARDALAYAAPVGEKDEYVERLLARVRPFMPVT